MKGSNMDVKEIQKRIDDLQTVIKQEENNRAKLEGRLQELQLQLEKEFSVKTSDEVSALITKLDSELKALGEERLHIMEELDKLLAGSK
jgi:chromosome segregation ATPase